VSLKYIDPRTNPEYKFDEVISDINYNFGQLSGGSSFTGAYLPLSGGTVSGTSYFYNLSGTSISGGTIVSGSTNLYSIFQPTGANTVFDSGINTYTGGTFYNQTINVSALTISTLVTSGATQLGTTTASSLSGGTVSGGTLFSGSTNLSSIFQQIGVEQTGIAAESNITTGGTFFAPVISLVTSPSINNLIASGNSQLNSITSIILSSASISANSFVLLDGNQNIGKAIISNSNGIGNWTNSITDNSSVNSIDWNSRNLYNSSGAQILNWSNTTGVTVFGTVQIYGGVDIAGTASTFNTQVVQTADNNITMNLSGSHVSAYGGGIIILSGQPGGQSSNWVIDVSGNWSANTQIIAGSGFNVSSGAIQSGGTDLYSIFLTTNDGNDITRVQPGTNTYTGGTDNFPTISLANSPSVNNFISSGNSQLGITTASSFSGSTVSGDTFYSGTTPLSRYFISTASTVVRDSIASTFDGLGGVVSTGSTSYMTMAYERS